MLSCRPTYYKSVFYTLLTTCCLLGCSQYSSKPGAVTFHNVSARYNAFFIGDQDLSEAEFAMKKAYKEDYNQLVPILYPMDSVLFQGQKKELLDAIKKASVVAEKHQNSKWVDNSYLILGKSRLYLGQWADGLEALRYVFANGKDDNDKNSALIVLMRAYIVKKDFSNALGVAEYLSQQPLDKADIKDFYLTKAYLHQQNEEFPTSIAIMEETFPLLNKSTETARLHFAVAQMYDRLGKYDLANKHYKSVSRNKPGYDLGFFASLNSLQNQVFLDPKKDLSSMGFNKMLKDRKNEDLKDRIYFTMGLLAEHKKDIPGAIGYLKKAAAVPSKNQTQKAYTYLQLARINYEALEQYNVSKAYYDSALAVLPQTSNDYKLVSDRNRALNAFVTEYTIVRNEDSLQTLARMNPAALDSKIDGIIEQREKERIEEEKKAREAMKASTFDVSQPIGDALPGGGTARRWELYDPAFVTKGRIEFKKQWGSRKLEDNWRRSEKVSVAISDAPVMAAIDSSTIVKKEPVLTKGTPEWDAIHAELKKSVPLTESQFLDSQKKKEEALYNLGKIYKFDLKEPIEAVATLKRLLSDFPDTQHKEEVYYLLYLTVDENSPDKLTWQNKLVAEFPNSTYARLIRVGDSKDDRGAASTDSYKAYEATYALYASGEYERALEEIERNFPNYQGGPLEDKFAMLRVFLVGKVRGREAYAAAISEFIRLYPNSNYLARLKEMQELSTLSAGKRQ